MFPLRAAHTRAAIIKAALRTLRLTAITIIVFVASLVFAQSGTHTVLILPFENTSKATGLDWISEAIPDVLTESMGSSSVYVIPREDRNAAFDRMGIPTTTKLSHETLYRISEQMDADYVILGDYDYDGKTFTTRAQLLDMKKLYLWPAKKESGPLTSLVELQRSLAWDLLQELDADKLGTKQDFISQFAPVRLDAFENYVRGLLATTREDKIQRFREAYRLNPNYTQAIFQLGKTYFASHEYESAASWFERIPKDDDKSSAANFYLGLSCFYFGDYARAETAFKELETRLPLPEVTNDLGVVLGRRGKRSELEYLEKAVKTDPNDPDYRFNLAVAYARVFDNANAVRQLKDVLRLRPSDAEARSFLEALGGSTTGNSLRPASASSGLPKLPLQRIKSNYDESSFRQLSMQIVRMAENRLANAGPREHAAFHIERGNQFLSQGFITEAENSFQEAIVLDPTSAAAHLGLAQAYEADGKDEQAGAEASAALRLQPSAAALLVLARQDLKQNRLDAASEKLDRALALDPKNQDAQKLKASITERLSGARN